MHPWDATAHELFMRISKLWGWFSDADERVRCERVVNIDGKKDARTKTSMRTNARVVANKDELLMNPWSPLQLRTQP